MDTNVYNIVSSLAGSDELVEDMRRLRKLPFGQVPHGRKRKGYKINPIFLQR